MTDKDARNRIIELHRRGKKPKIIARRAGVSEDEAEAVINSWRKQRRTVVVGLGVSGGLAALGGAVYGIYAHLGSRYRAERDKFFARFQRDFEQTMLAAEIEPGVEEVFDRLVVIPGKSYSFERDFLSVPEDVREAFLNAHEEYQTNPLAETHARAIEKMQKLEAQLRHSEYFTDVLRRATACREAHILVAKKRDEIKEWVESKGRDVFGMYGGSKEEKTFVLMSEDGIELTPFEDKGKKMFLQYLREICDNDMTHEEGFRRIYRRFLLARPEMGDTPDNRAVLEIFLLMERYEPEMVKYRGEPKADSILSQLEVIEDGMKKGMEVGCRDSIFYSAIPQMIESAGTYLAQGHIHLVHKPGTVPGAFEYRPPSDNDKKVTLNAGPHVVISLGRNGFDFHLCEYNDSMLLAQYRA